MLNSLRHLASFDDRVGDSFDIYANVRTVRFNEMEYSVPAEYGPACLREILKLIQDKDLRTWFPIEYRYVKADDIALSMFEGRDSCSISVHQHYQMDHHNFFAAIEPISGSTTVARTGQIAHAQCAHPATAVPALARVCRRTPGTGPSGRFLNAHLSSILGVS